MLWTKPPAAANEALLSRSWIRALAAVRAERDVRTCRRTSECIWDGRLERRHTGKHEHVAHGHSGAIVASSEHARPRRKEQTRNRPPASYILFLLLPTSCFLLPDCYFLIATSHFPLPTSQQQHGVDRWARTQAMPVYMYMYMLLHMHMPVYMLLHAHACVHVRVHVYLLLYMHMPEHCSADA